ncbi:TPA: restriction endonuclease subunit S, partial [Pseudomonas aeruginosa]
MSQVFPAHWDVLPFSLAVKDATSEYSKLQKSEYLEQGRFPIVDQGQQKFGGYTDDESVVSLDGCPAIVFGDHTRIFKFIDEPFCLGADGAKV